MIGMVRSLWARVTDPRPWRALGAELALEADAVRQLGEVSGQLADARGQVVLLELDLAAVRQELGRVTAERDDLLAKAAASDDAPTVPLSREVATLLAQVGDLEQENTRLAAEARRLQVELAERDTWPSPPQAPSTRADLLRERERAAALEERLARAEGRPYGPPYGPRLEAPAAPQVALVRRRLLRRRR